MTNHVENFGLVSLISSDIPDVKEVKKFINPISQLPEIYYVANNLLIISRVDNQLELPLASIAHIASAIKYKFYEKENKGKLVFNWEEIIDGQKIALQRGMALWGDGISGFTCYNCSRSSYIYSGRVQKHDFFDVVLLEYGILDFMFEISKKI